jgi:nucleoside-diphosphate-sugar epimerase
MSERLALVTGAAGEMGHLLIPALKRRGFEVVTVDLQSLSAELASSCRECVDASILDDRAMHKLFAKYRFSHVYHLAAILSTKAEKDPGLAHRVNVEGTYGLYRLCLQQAEETGTAPTLLFPSSIAVYGLPDAAAKAAQGMVKESEWLVPSGMYGCNKLYCELIGNYLSRVHGNGESPVLDFRAIRFPGLISAETLPTGGTTDYAPEMIHAAAQTRAYDCFVREDTRLPFMTMPDAVEALLRLADADPSALSTRVYNIKAFSVSAGEIRDAVLRQFPGARIGFEPSAARQAIVDSWPEDVDDSLARRDWGLDPRHGFAEALDEYLLPALQKRYAVKAPAES